MTLWILSCKMSEHMDILFAFYAQNEREAEHKARKIQREQGYERINLKAYPYGFVIHRNRMSGIIEEERA